jgi:predicted TIM-barrel enzyme
LHSLPGSPKLSANIESDSTIQRFNDSTIQRFNDSTIQRFNDSTIQRFNDIMPNPWTGKGNPYTRTEVVDRLRAQLQKGRPIIAAGAGTGISAKFIERGGADLIIIYNSGRFRMAGRGSTCGLMAYGDANAIAMEIGEHEVLPVVEEIPVICGVHATDPRRRMWHWLLQVKNMGFSGVNNFPTHCIVDGKFRQVLEETGMSVRLEFEMVALARKMDLFSIVYVSTAEEAKAMAQAGADAIIAHVGTTIGGSIGVKKAVVSMEETVRRCQTIIDGAKEVRNDIIFLSHGGPIATPDDAAYINQHTDCVGFVGASSLERLALEDSLTELTRRFKKIPVQRKALQAVKLR